MQSVWIVARQGLQGCPAGISAVEGAEDVSAVLALWRDSWLREGLRAGIERQVGQSVVQRLRGLRYAVEFCYGRESRRRLAFA